VRKLLIALAIAAMLATVVAAAKPAPGTGYEIVHRTVSYPATAIINNNGKGVSEIIACPAGKRAVNGGAQSVGNGPDTPADFPDAYSNPVYASFTPNFGIGVSGPGVEFPPDPGPTADGSGWRVNGTLTFSGWGQEGIRGVDWELYSAEVTFYVVCINP
jgi:hypothetical protein